MLRVFKFYLAIGREITIIGDGVELDRNAGVYIVKREKAEIACFERRSVTGYTSEAF